ncbi:MAG: hypothetical protein ACRD4Y_11840, partial [Candidatus Acidiferrales bacterium]
LQLINSTGTTNYSITLSSTTQGNIVQMDINSSASGSFQLQNAADFSNPGVAGGYVFDFSGVSAASNPESIIGRFTADGNGGVTTGVFDSNEAGGTPSGQQAFPAGGFYQLDTNGNGTNFGRGTANIAGHNFAFYVVDSTRIKLLGTDSTEAFSGEAFAQQNMSYTAASLNGGYAFLIGGAHSGGPITTAGRFNADGAGNLTSIDLDENDSGVYTPIPSQGGTVSGTYTVDANGLGGGAATWTDTKVGTFSFIFYLITPSSAVFQETDSSITSDGTLLAQTSSPVTLDSLAGPFAFGWSGADGNGEEDFVGQMKLTSSTGNNTTGIMNLNEFGTANQYFNIQLNGPLTITPPGTGPNTLAVTAVTGLSTTFNFTAYPVDSNTVFLVGVDGVRVVSGTAVRQQ